MKTITQTDVFHAGNRSILPAWSQGRIAQTGFRAQLHSLARARQPSVLFMGLILGVVIWWADLRQAYIVFALAFAVLGIIYALFEEARRAH